LFVANERYSEAADESFVVIQRSFVVNERSIVVNERSVATKERSIALEERSLSPAAPWSYPIPAAASAAQAVSGWTMSLCAPDGGPPLTMTWLASRLSHLPAARG